MKDMKVVWAGVSACGDKLYWIRDDTASGIRDDVQAYSLFMTDGFHYGRLGVWSGTSLKLARKEIWRYLASHPKVVGLPPGDGTRCQNPVCPMCGDWFAGSDLPNTPTIDLGEL